MTRVRPLLNLKMKCSEDVAMLQKYKERKRIFKFLDSLNVGHDQVCVQIVGNYLD